MRVLALSAVFLVASIIGMPAVAKMARKQSWNATLLNINHKGVVVLWNENKQQGFTNNLKQANQHFYPHLPLKFPIA